MKRCLKCPGWETCPQYKNGYCVPKKAKPKLYSVYIWRKIHYFDGEKTFQCNAGFCFNDFKSLNRYFENKNYIIEGIAIKERVSGKIIYRGNNYSEMLTAIEDYKAAKKKTLEEFLSLAEEAMEVKNNGK